MRRYNRCPARGLRKELCCKYTTAIRGILARFQSDFGRQKPKLGCNIICPRTDIMKKDVINAVVCAVDAVQR